MTFAGNWLVSNGKMGWGREFDGHRVQLDVLPVATDFIDFFGMTVKEGRNFSPSDDLNPDGTFIMNEQTMLKFPFLKLGARLQGHADNPAEIVGIVKDFNFKPLQYGVDPIALYVFGSKPWWPLSVVYARIDGADIAGTFQYIRDAVEEFNPAINGDDIYLRFLDESIGSLYQKEEKLNSLISITAVLSLIISNTEDAEQALYPDDRNMLRSVGTYCGADHALMGERVCISGSGAGMDFLGGLGCSACRNSPYRDSPVLEGSRGQSGRFAA